MSALHQAVACAIAEAVGGASLTPGGDDHKAAVAAVGVVLAEVQRAVEDMSTHQPIRVESWPAVDRISRAQALAVLAVLEDGTP